MKNKKIVFSIVAFLLLVNTVYALSNFVSILGGLHNSNGSSNTISGTAKLSDSFKMYMTNIENMSNGPIIVRMKAKRYNLGIVTNTRYYDIPVSGTTSTSSQGIFNYNSNASKTKTEWTDLTNDSSVDAVFRAENN